MKFEKPGRRQFLKGGAALAGLAVGAIRSASDETLGSGLADALRAEEALPYGIPSRFETTRRDWWSRGRYAMSSTASTPLQDSMGIITPSALHFVISHGNAPLDIDPRQHRLLIQGLVDRPLIFTLEELKRLPSVTRICFIECGANSSYALSAGRFGPAGPETAQQAHGRVSCSEWTGVLLSLLLREAGLQKRASWVVGEGAEAGWTISIPLERAGEILVAYGQNGEAVRPEQGYPLRLVAPGFPGDHCVKWLRRIQVVDQPHRSIRDGGDQEWTKRPDGKGSRLFKPQMPVKSVITFPSGGHRLPGRGFYEISGIAWSGGGVVRRVEVSTNGGRTWKDARLQQPVLPKAWTRFGLDWHWNGEEALLQSRATDELGDTQPTIAELAGFWGATPAQWKESLQTSDLFNPIQPWSVTSEGSVHNALFP